MAINLELISSLTTHHKTIIPCRSKADIKEAQAQSVDYWMRNKRGKGWIILSVDINTETWVFWEHAVGVYQQRRLGFMKPSSHFLQGMTSPHIMFIVESDKWTPSFIHDFANSTASDRDNRIVVLEHLGDW